MLKLADSVERYKRVIKIGNPITIKMAEKELLNAIPKLKPMDLVNTLKMIVPKKDSSPIVTEKIVAECKRRNFKEFKGQDIALLLTLNELPTAAELVPVIVEKFFFGKNSIVRDMRTTDLCISLLGLARQPSNVKQLLPDVIATILHEFVKGDRIKQFREINVSQVLSALSTKTSLRAIESLRVSNGELVQSFVSKLGLKTENNSEDFSNKSIAFCLFSFVNMFQAARVPLDDPQRLSLLAKLAEEAFKRDSLDQDQLVACIRALGRAHALDEKLVTNRLLVSIDLEKLDGEQRSGLEQALKTVNMTLTNT